MATSNRNRKEYSNSELVLGNLAIILWIILGAISFALFYPLAAIPFFALAAFLIFYELGKHGCETCYYCKTCTIGMGKLPELFFKHEGTANVNRRALRIFPFVYVFLSVLPVGLTSVSIIQQFEVFKILLLAGILAFSFITGIIRRKNFV